MVILSFSVKEDELRAGAKIRTTRRYSPEKYDLWQRTLPGGDLLLQGWWQQRRPDGYRLFERHGRDLYRMTWVRDERYGGLLPAREWVPLSGQFYLMDPIDVYRYVNEEGFDGDLEELASFFASHYERVTEQIFQSIAFPEE